MADPKSANTAALKGQDANARDNNEAPLSDAPEALTPLTQKFNDSGFVFEGPETTPYPDFEAEDDNDVDQVDTRARDQLQQDLNKERGDNMDGGHIERVAHVRNNAALEDKKKKENYDAYLMAILDQINANLAEIAEINFRLAEINERKIEINERKIEINERLDEIDQELDQLEPYMETQSLEEIAQIYLDPDEYERTKDDPEARREALKAHFKGQINSDDPIARYYALLAEKEGLVEESNDLTREEEELDREAQYLRERRQERESENAEFQTKCRIPGDHESFRNSHEAMREAEVVLDASQERLVEITYLRDASENADVLSSDEDSLDLFADIYGEDPGLNSPNATLAFNNSASEPTTPASDREYQPNLPGVVVS